jgi:hypothetical protein
MSFKLKTNKRTTVSYKKIAKRGILEELFEDDIINIIKDFLPKEKNVKKIIKISKEIEEIEEEDIDWEEFNDFYPIEYYDNYDSYLNNNIYKIDEKYMDYKEKDLISDDYLDMLGW